LKHPVHHGLKGAIGLLLLAGSSLAIGQAANEPVRDTAVENIGAHYQTTYVFQRKPAFSANYSGPNSLSPDAERSYTLTAGAAFGVRPWRDTELYFDPEMALGLPMSDLTGLAGFPSGELSRAAGRNPTFYRQRLFLRRTWNRGGGSEALESGFNQLASRVDRDRFVLTAGNFSLLDLFDDNRYAHDPRMQFMNWSHMTYAAYDYAADARGYAWGVAGEWYAGDWVLRLARMTVPREPNQQRLDYQIFKHYGDQVELEHGHRLAGREGKLRLLAWRGRGLLAKFDDALALAASSGGVPDINAARSGVRTKYGLGVNAEQDLGRGVGGFVRAMWADGGTETESFTEADRSLAGGLSLAGAAWDRAEDVLGVSLAWNGLSQARRRYLEAGGISFFIGDGALNYRPEAIVEAYYSIAVGRKLWLSLDAQRIAHPAYNANRGPAVVLGLRLHADF